MKNLFNWCISNERCDLIKEWSKKLNHIDMKDVPKNSHKLYWWKCKKGHTFKSTIEDRIANKISCPLCQGSLSFPEMMIYYYLSQYYPSMLHYKPEWLENKELDVYSSRANVVWNGNTYHSIGIEYDGAKYHQDKDKDINKNQICERNGIHIIRIREYGCPSLPDAECILLSSGHTENDIALAMKQILIRLGIKEPRINITKDLNIIRQKYHTYTH